MHNWIKKMRSKIEASGDPMIIQLKELTNSY